jgi:hypothetical protein
MPKRATTPSTSDPPVNARFRYATNVATVGLDWRIDPVITASPIATSGAQNATCAACSAKGFRGAGGGGVR